MIRVSGRYRKATRPVAPSSRPTATPSPEPVPGVSVRCECGRVVRTKANGRPRAHDYCKFAPATC